MVVLGYSRLLWLQFYPRQTMRTLMRGLQSAFEYVGGVPQELLFDQLKAVIIDSQSVVKRLLEKDLADCRHRLLDHKVTRGYP